MKRKLLLVVLTVQLAVASSGQGLLSFSNGSRADPRAFTRVGSIDGPLAGPEFCAQMLVGETPGSLTPVGMSARHLPADLAGQVYGGILEVPGIPSGETAHVQMVAWDSRVWGTSLAGVPPEWLGRTDIVPAILGDQDIGPSGLARFTQPAVVPVPEPSVLALTTLAGALLWTLRPRQPRLGR